MSVPDLKPALLSLVSALAASLCCLLPLAVIVLGLGSGAFMAATEAPAAVEHVVLDVQGMT